MGDASLDRSSSSRGGGPTTGWRRVFDNRADVANDGRFSSCVVLETRSFVVVVVVVVVVRVVGGTIVHDRGRRFDGLSPAPVGFRSYRNLVDEIRSESGPGFKTYNHFRRGDSTESKNDLM
jgi:hypothetical protein